MWLNNQSHVQDKPDQQESGMRVLLREYNPLKMSDKDTRTHSLEMGGTQIVQYYIKYHSLYNYYGVLINTDLHASSEV